jgi:hypothetical protein
MRAIIRLIFTLGVKHFRKPSDVGVTFGGEIWSDKGSSADVKASRRLLDDRGTTLCFEVQPL